MAQPEQKRRIDYDRGVMFSQHPTTGMNIYMYMDTPGVYLNVFENPVHESLAKEAGFDVEKYARARIRQERMAQAKNAIEAELAGVDPDEVKEVKSIGGFKIMDIGLGRHNVLDPDGNTLNSIPLTLEVAEKLAERLQPSK